MVDSKLHICHSWVSEGSSLRIAELPSGLLPPLWRLNVNLPREHSILFFLLVIDIQQYLPLHPYHMLGDGCPKSKQSTVTVPSAWESGPGSSSETPVLQPSMQKPSASFDLSLYRQYQSTEVSAIKKRLLWKSLISKSDSSLLWPLWFCVSVCLL